MNMIGHSRDLGIHHLGRKPLVPDRGQPKSERIIVISRERLEAKIEELIGLLDFLDGDPDVEANGDELDVGMPESWCRSRSYSETVLEDDEDGGEAEPEETDEDGDEQDSNLSEDDNMGAACFVVGMI